MADEDLLVPPENGVTVRMYRQGHGDCFLIAFPRDGGGDPYYVMIDCGYKPGSQAFLNHGKSIGDVVEHLHAACRGHLDLAILTHEHQDHLNGIWKQNKPYFANFRIDEAWVAWTENPDHTLANDLRKRHKDQLLGLLEARRELEASGETASSYARLDALLGFEVGGADEALNMRAMLAAAKTPEKSINKRGLKLVKDKAATKRGARFLTPGKKPVALRGTAGIRAFILGPPENAELIADEDPRDSEGFPQNPRFSFAGAVGVPPKDRVSPFRRHFSVPLEGAARNDEFFATYYDAAAGPDDDRDGVEVPCNPGWRRIDTEWLYSAEALALTLNKGINNTSLVIAFELPKTKKVLLFAGDAQRGNWVSWKDVTFEDGRRTVSAKDLLARAVLYKVGHHGSHNATLTGTPDDEHPNLAWMGQGPAAAEFTAMITAVTKWARTMNPPWVHPLPSIQAALARKTRGRVFQTDQNEPAKPTDVPAAEWKQFTDRSVCADLYFDWTVLDE